MNTGGPTPSPGFNVPPPPAMSGTPGAVSAAAASGIAYPPALQKWIRRCLAAAANNKQELGTIQGRVLAYVGKIRSEGTLSSIDWENHPLVGGDSTTDPSLAANSSNATASTGNMVNPYTQMQTGMAGSMGGQHLFQQQQQQQMMMMQQQSILQQQQLQMFCMFLIQMGYPAQTMTPQQIWELYASPVVQQRFTVYCNAYAMALSQTNGMNTTNANMNMNMMNMNMAGNQNQSNIMNNTMNNNNTGMAGMAPPPPPPPPSLLSSSSSSTSSSTFPSTSSSSSSSSSTTTSSSVDAPKSFVNSGVHQDRLAMISSGRNTNNPSTNNTTYPYNNNPYSSSNNQYNMGGSGGSGGRNTVTALGLANAAGIGGNAMYSNSGGSGSNNIPLGGGSGSGSSNNNPYATASAGSWNQTSGGSGLSSRWGGGGSSGSSSSASTSIGSSGSGSGTSDHMTEIERRRKEIEEKLKNVQNKWNNNTEGLSNKDRDSDGGWGSKGMKRRRREGGGGGGSTDEGSDYHTSDSDDDDDDDDTSYGGRGGWRKGSENKKKKARTERGGSDGHHHHHHSIQRHDVWSEGIACLYRQGHKLVVAWVDWEGVRREYIQMNNPHDNKNFSALTRHPRLTKTQRHVLRGLVNQQIKLVNNINNNNNISNGNNGSNNAVIDPNWNEIKQKMPHWIKEKIEKGTKAGKSTMDIALESDDEGLGGGGGDGGEHEAKMTQRSERFGSHLVIERRRPISQSTWDMSGGGGGGGGGGDDDEYASLTSDKGVLIGTSEALEKKFLRLTRAPDPSTVRPPHVLEKAFARVKGLWEEKKDYKYCCEQLKSIRQDLVIQHQRTRFAVDVYEFHGRTAVEMGDLSEFNQCLTQLKYLYSDPDPLLSTNRLEFSCYALLYAVISDNKGSILRQITYLGHHRSTPEADYCMQIRQAVMTSDVPSFFRLVRSGSAPFLTRYLVNKLLNHMRLTGLTLLLPAYRPIPVPLSVISTRLAFDSIDECVDFVTVCGGIADISKNTITAEPGKLHQPIRSSEAEDSVKASMEKGITHADFGLAWQWR